MEYYYRCEKCGRRTPSFEYEDYLNDYALDWEITDDHKICDKCKNNENNINKVDKYLLIFMIISLFIILILGFFSF